MSTANTWQTSVRVHCRALLLQLNFKNRRYVGRTPPRSRSPVCYVLIWMPFNKRHFCRRVFAWSSTSCFLRREWPTMSEHIIVFACFEENNLILFGRKRWKNRLLRSAITTVPCGQILSCIPKLISAFLMRCNKHFCVDIPFFPKLFFFFITAAGSTCRGRGDAGQHHVKKRCCWKTWGDSELHTILYFQQLWRIVPIFMHYTANHWHLRVIWYGLSNRPWFTIFTPLEKLYEWHLNDNNIRDFSLQPVLWQYVGSNQLQSFLICSHNSNHCSELGFLSLRDTLMGIVVFHLLPSALTVSFLIDSVVQL